MGLSRIIKGILFALLIIISLPFVVFAQKGDYHEGGIYVQFNSGASVVPVEEFESEQEKEKVLGNYPGELRQNIKNFKVYSVKKSFEKINTGKLQYNYTFRFDTTVSMKGLLKALEKHSYIEFAERIPKSKKFQTPDDFDQSRQWNLAQVNAQQAWNINTGSEDVVVAVVDDAVQVNHPDLEANIWENSDEVADGTDSDGNGYVDDIHGYDVADSDGDPTPPSRATKGNFSHGTHCAGIVSAVTNNGSGIASLGYNVSVMGVKTSPSATGGLQNPYDGIVYAVNAGADVISMSWGGGGSSQTNQSIIDMAHNQGITLVAAAGNSNTDAPMYPASYDHVISVGATDQQDKKAGFSNYGPAVDLMAPGVDIYSTVDDDNVNFGEKSGTSMACPLVSGLAGLMNSERPGIHPDSLESCLKRNAVNIDGLNPSYQGELGAGRIDAASSLQCLRTVPLADFSVGDTIICPGESVTFSNETVGNVDNYQWTFDGGTPSSSTAEDPSVTYSSTGTYRVELEVSNQYGSDIKEATQYIHVARPEAVMSGDATIPEGGRTFLKVEFSGPGPYDITYEDGSNTYTKTGITQNPYYFSVSPDNATTYTLTEVSSNCNGTVSGEARVRIDDSGEKQCSLTVNDYQKISDTRGNLNTDLGNTDRFGRSIVPVGDLDQDGVKDLIVGTPRDDDGGRDNGAIRVLFMNSDGTVRSVQKISATQGGGSSDYIDDRWGNAVAAVGDLDGDGVPDVAVGDAHEDQIAQQAGAVSILFLNRDGTVKGHQKITQGVGGFTGSLGHEDRFGATLVSVSDMNNDGNRELVASTRKYDDGGTDRGAVWVLFMNSDGTVQDHQRISDTHGNFTADLDNRDRFGVGMANLDDLNGDGIQDIAVGAQWDDDGGTDKGAAYVLFLDRDGTVKVHTKISETQGGFSGSLENNGDFAWTLGGLKDLDGDGNDELISAARRKDVGGTDRGAVRVLFLRGDGTVKHNLMINSNTDNFTGELDDNDFFGQHVSPAGDLNGDGQEELAVGSIHDDDGGTDRGAVYIFDLKGECDNISCSVAADFVAGDSLICTGDTVTFTNQSNNANAYEWFAEGSPESTSENFSYVFDEPGDYTIRLVAHADSCIDMDSLTIHVSPQPEVEASADTSICADSTLQLTATGADRYEWMPSDGLSCTNCADPVVTFDEPERRTYVVRGVNDGGCSDLDTVVVNARCCDSEGFIPEAAFVTDTGTYCMGDSVHITNTSRAGAGAEYDWDFGEDANPASSTGENPGPVYYSTGGQKTIKLIVEDSCGVDSLSKTIAVYPLPEVDAGPDTTVCVGDSVQIGSTGIGRFDYQWMPTVGLNDPEVADPYVYGLAAGRSVTYVVRVESPATACANYDTVTVTSEACISDSCDAGEDKRICRGDSVQLNGQLGCVIGDTTLGDCRTVNAPEGICNNGDAVSNANGHVNVSGGTVRIPAGMNFTGGVNINDGVLLICGSASPSYVNFSGGDIIVTGNASFNNLNMNNSGSELTNYGRVTFGNITFNGAVTNHGEMTAEHHFNVNSGASWYNTGTFTAEASFHNNSDALNYGTLIVTRDLKNNAGGNFMNGCRIEVGRQFHNNQQFVHEGRITGATITYINGGSEFVMRNSKLVTDNVHLNGSVTGTGNGCSSFEVNGTSVINGSATITGTVDYCDTDGIETQNVSFGSQVTTDCSCDPVSGNVPAGVSYRWIPARGLSDPFVAQPMASPDQTTTYTVIVKDQQGNEQRGTVTVEVQDPAVNVQDKTVCQGESVQLEPEFECFDAPVTNGCTEGPSPEIGCNECARTINGSGGYANVNPNEKVCVPEGAFYQGGVNMNGGTLVVCGEADFSGLNLNGSGKVVNRGSMSFDNFNMNSTDAELINHGVLEGNALAVRGVFENHGEATLQQDLNINPYAGFDNTGSLTVYASFNNNTASMADNRGVLIVEGDLKNNAGAEFSNTCTILVGGSFRNNATFVNEGTVEAPAQSNLNGGSELVMMSGSLVTGDIQLNGSVEGRGGDCSSIEVTGVSTINGNASVTGNLDYCDPDGIETMNITLGNAVTTDCNCDMPDPGQGNNNITYTWMPATGLSDASVRSPEASPSQTTTYTLEVTTASGEVMEDEVTVEVNSCAASSGKASGQGLAYQVYPNPFTNRISLEITKAHAEKVDVQVVSLEGNPVYKKENVSTGKRVQFGASLPAGVYMVKVIGEDQVEVKRIVKQ